MKTLHRYLARQMLLTLGMTVFVFTLVLLLGNVIKQILQLLVNRQATMAVALKGIVLLIPYVLAFSLPIGMLTAALLVFGRLSADQELTAARASGVSLLSLITPVLLLSVAVSVLCAWLNFDLAPSCRTAYNKLIFSAQTNSPVHWLRNGESVPLGDFHVWVRKVLPDGTNLQEVTVTRYDRLTGECKYMVHGPTGTLTRDLTNHEIDLIVHDGQAWNNTSSGLAPVAGGEIPLVITNIDEQSKALLTVSVNNMTFRQLRARLHELERPLAPPLHFEKTNSVTAKARRDIKRDVQDETMPVMVYMNRQVAFSFACIGFTLIGIPLGIRAHRRETSIGVATALVLMLIYYSFIVLAQAWENHPERAPCVIVWAPNFIFQVVGAVLLWQANRSAGR
jgi:lipopolysaccharide export system permease protein